MILKESDLRRLVSEMILESVDKTYWSHEDITISLKDILEYFKTNKIEPKEMNTQEIFYKFSEGKEVLKVVKKGGKESEKRVDRANLKYPVIVVKKNNETYILDGNHRLQKAKNEGEENIKVHTLDLDDGPNIPPEYELVF